MPNKTGAPTGTASGSVDLAIARFLLCTYEKYQQKYQQKEKRLGRLRPLSSRLAGVGPERDHLDHSSTKKGFPFTPP